MIRWVFVYQEYRMHELTKHQREILLKNPNIKKITTKHVVFTSEFKIQAVESHYQGMLADEIFKKAGIRLDFFKKYYATYCIKKWKVKYKKTGKFSFHNDERGKSLGRGRPKKLDNLSYEELRAIVDIQKEVIEELKKKRALARRKS